MKNIYFIIVSLFIIFYIFVSIRKNKLSITNSFIWVVFCVALLLLAIFPKSLDWLATLLGIAIIHTAFNVACVVLLVPFSSLLHIFPPVLDVHALLLLVQEAVACR